MNIDLDQFLAVIPLSPVRGVDVKISGSREDALLLSGGAL